MQLLEHELTPLQNGWHNWRATLDDAVMLAPEQAVSIGPLAALLPWRVSDDGRTLEFILSPQLSDEAQHLVPGQPIAALPYKATNWQETGDILLIADAAHLGGAIRLAEWLHRQKRLSLLLLQWAGPPAFRPVPSRILLPALPGHVIATLPLLEDWGIPARLAGEEALPGFYEGCVTALARDWLARHPQTRVFTLADGKLRQAVAELTEQLHARPAIALSPPA